MEGKKNFVINEKKLNKLFSVQVTKRKYDGWKHSPLFEKMGGLYGLCIGADKKREITVKIRFKMDLPWVIFDEVRKKLRDEYETVDKCKVTDYWLTEFQRSWIQDFRGEVDQEAKEYCKRIREEIKEEIREILKEVIEETDFEIWNTEFEELKDLGVIREI